MAANDPEPLRQITESELPVIQPRRIEMREIESSLEEMSSGQVPEMKFEKLAVRPHRNQSQLMKDMKMEKIAT